MASTFYSARPISYMDPLSVFGLLSDPSTTEWEIEGIQPLSHAVRYIPNDMPDISKLCSTTSFVICDRAYPQVIHGIIEVLSGKDSLVETMVFIRKQCMDEDTLFPALAEGFIGLRYKYAGSRVVSYVHKENDRMKHLLGMAGLKFESEGQHKEVYALPIV